MRATFCGALLALSFPALGCGICVEDRIAQVYDHAVVMRAFGAGRQVAFFHIEGKIVPGTDARAIATLANSAAGVDRGSARVSLEARTLSVAFDPGRMRFASLQGQLDRKLAAKSLSLLPLKLMQRPAEWVDASR